MSGSGGVRITAVTFDVWETLIRDQPQPSGSRAQLRAARMSAVLRRHGLSVGESQARETYSALLARLESETWSKYMDIGTREQLSIFLSLLSPQMAALADEEMLAELDEAYTSPIFDYPPALAPGAERALEAVRQKGLRLAVVCNTGVTPGRDIRKLLDGYGVLKCFHAVVFSDEERLRKPRPEIFERALARLGAIPAAAVHIGDDATSDIAGAKGAGMKAIMVRATPPPHLPVPPDLHVGSLFEVPEAIEKL